MWERLRNMLKMIDGCGKITVNLRLYLDREISTLTMLLWDCSNCKSDSSCGIHLLLASTSNNCNAIDN